MAKRNNMNKKVDTVNTNFKEEISKLVKVLVTVLAFFGLFYLLTIYLTTKDGSNKYKKIVDAAVVQYSEILVGTSFSKSGEYIVVYYDKSDEDINSIYTPLISSYKEKDEHLSIYNVDMSNSFNKSFSYLVSNSNPSNISDLKIAGPTLIKFTDGKVDEYIEGKEDITNYLS